MLPLRSTSLLTLAAAASVSAAGLHPRQSSSSASSVAAVSSATSPTSSTSASSSNSSTSTATTTSAAAAIQTPGFVNNGTVGTYPCALSNSTINPLAYSPSTVPGCANAEPPVYPYNDIRLRAPDGSIRATFLPYGASISELWVQDKWGQFRDIVIGFDNKTNYGTDSVHNYFGPVVGRYANRIKNGTFELNNQTYHTPLNEKGLDTLHGGMSGYDRASFKVVDFNSSWVQFSHYDPSGNQGFPGSVNSTIDYFLENNATWRIAMGAVASEPTPIMLSSHVYWNLEAYNETQSILNYTMHMPEVTGYIATDGTLIPTGELPSVNGTAYDFRQPTVMQDLFNKTDGLCGTDCKGWDSAFIMAGHEANSTANVLEWWSPNSGIKLSIATNQNALQLYTCDGISGPGKDLPRKRSQGGDGTLNEIYGQYSCAVLEAEGYIDAINNPQWNQSQIYGPNDKYEWTATYTFSQVNADGSPANAATPGAANVSSAAALSVGSSTKSAAEARVGGNKLALAAAVGAVGLALAAF